MPSARRSSRRRKDLPRTDPAEAARYVALRYVNDAKPGISCRATGSGFSYLAADGDTIIDEETHPIDSSDVNEYLKEIGGGELTAKDFRTWTGMLLTVRRLTTKRTRRRERLRGGA